VQQLLISWSAVWTSQAVIGHHLRPHSGE
jgi:hypothetical protein